MNRRGIPVYELSEYRQSTAEAGIYVADLEASLKQHQNRRLPHSHPFFQVSLMNGKGSYMHDFVDYRIAGSVIAFTSPGQVHAVRPGFEFHGIFVSFTQEFFDSTMAPPSKLLDYPFFFRSDVTPLLQLGPEDFARYYALFRELQSEFEAGLTGVHDVLRGLLQVIFGKLARHYPEVHRSDTSSRPAQLVREFRLAVETRFREFTSLADYAALLKVTVNHLNDTVREQTGQSAGEILRLRRLLDAKRLLLHSEMSVSEIGYHLGFEDPSYFSRFFRRYEKQSPAEFRTAIREKYQRNAP